MVVQVALDELDAREVLPVAHRLFEQGFVGAAEVAVDFVGNHSVIPDSFFAGSGCSCGPPVGRGADSRIFGFEVETGEELVDDEVLLNRLATTESYLSFSAWSKVFQVVVQTLFFEYDSWFPVPTTSCFLYLNNFTTVFTQKCASSCACA